MNQDNWIIGGKEEGVQQQSGTFLNNTKEGFYDSNNLLHQSQSESVRPDSFQSFPRPDRRSHIYSKPNRIVSEYRFILPSQSQTDSNKTNESRNSTHGCEILSNNGEKRTLSINGRCADFSTSTQREEYNLYTQSRIHHQHHVQPERTKPIRGSADWVSAAAANSDKSITNGSASSYSSVKYPRRATNAAYQADDRILNEPHSEAAYRRHPSESSKEFHQIEDDDSFDNIALRRESDDNNWLSADLRKGDRAFNGASINGNHQSKTKSQQIVSQHLVLKQLSRYHIIDQSLE